MPERFYRYIHRREGGSSPLLSSRKSSSAEDVSLVNEIRQDLGDEEIRKI